MMKTLAKVAIGVAMAKGVSSMMNKSGDAPLPGARRSRQPETPKSKPGTGGLFGAAHSPQAHRPAKPGSLEEELGALLGNKGQAGGGLGGLLDQLGATPGQTGAKPRDSFEDSWGGEDEIARRDAAQTPDLGGLLGGLLQAATGGSAAGSKPKGGFGDLLNQAIARQDEPEHPPTPRQEATAALMLRAMIQAAKSDGKVDRDEQQKLLGRLGEVSPEERAFVQDELSRPVDVRTLAQTTPRGMEQQLYTMSVMGIDLDSRAEANHLHELAQALGLDPQNVNHIHDRLGVPQLYR
jgi:uncharacterized membrane protein YebE (DUF533 family)